MILMNIIRLTFSSGVVCTGIGGVLGSIVKKDSNRIVSIFLSFASGVMLSVVCFDLLADSINKTKINLSEFIITIVSLIFGYILLFFIDYLLGKHENKLTVKSSNISNKSLFISSILIGIAVTLHDLPEGLIVGMSSYIKDSNSIFILAIIMGLHNIPEGMSISLPLIASGINKYKAISIAFLAGVPEVIGGIAGYYLGSLNENLLIFSMGFASGAMLYVVFGELLPQSYKIDNFKNSNLATLLGIIIGIVILKFNNYF